MKLVVDASVAVAATATPLGFERLRAFELIAPPLLWIEAESVLHAMLWRGEVRADQAIEMRDPSCNCGQLSGRGRSSVTPTTAATYA